MSSGCCVLDSASQEAASVKQLCVVTGVDHEVLLNGMLADAGIAFWTEDELREKGFYKTPDAMLQV